MTIQVGDRVSWTRFDGQISGVVTDIRTRRLMVKPDDSNFTFAKTFDAVRREEKQKEAGIMTTHPRRLAGLLLAILAAALAMMLWVPAANASPYTHTDQQYLSALAGYGLVFDDGGAAAVKLGHDIGALVRAEPTYATFDKIVLNGLKTSFSTEQVAAVTWYAVYFYAPEYAPLLKAWANSRGSGAVVAR